MSGGRITSLPRGPPLGNEGRQRSAGPRLQADRQHDRVDRVAGEPDRVELEAALGHTDLVALAGRLREDRVRALPVLGEEPGAHRGPVEAAGRAPVEEQLDGPAPLVRPGRPGPGGRGAPSGANGLAEVQQAQAGRQRGREVPPQQAVQAPGGRGPASEVGPRTGLRGDGGRRLQGGGRERRVGRAATRQEEQGQQDRGERRGRREPRGQRPSAPRAACATCLAEMPYSS
jgi:hypothetical protein